MLKSLIKNDKNNNEIVILSQKEERCLKSMLIYMFKKSKNIDKYTSINHEKTELTITTSLNTKIKYFIR